MWSARAACSASDCMSESSISENRLLSTGFATTRTPKKRSRKVMGTAMTDLTRRLGSSCFTIPESFAASAISSPRPVCATRPAIPSPRGNSSDFSTCSMNFARVVSLPFTWSGSGLWGGNSPSTATPLIMFPSVFSKMQALRAPVQRIEACTMRWCSSWRDRPSPRASAIRCMKSSARWRSVTARLLCISSLSNSRLRRSHATHRAETTSRRLVIRKKGMEGPP